MKTYKRKVMVFSPTSDITAYELAKCMDIFWQCRGERMLGSPHTFDASGINIESHPSEIRRHFKEDYMVSPIEYPVVRGMWNDICALFHSMVERRTSL